MALILTRGRLLLHHSLTDTYWIRRLVAAAAQNAAAVTVTITSYSGRRLHQVFDPFHKPYARNFCTSLKTGKLGWENSTRSVLLRKIDDALKDRKLNEAWVSFNKFKRSFGFPAGSVMTRLISELSYSSDYRWVRKACKVVFLVLEEKPNSLRIEVLLKVILSLARAQIPIPACMILRLLLERHITPPLDMLRLVVWNMVQSEKGTCLATNFLVQLCDCVLHLTTKRSDHVKIERPDTMLFNIVLDACVRFKSSLKGHHLVELMAQTGVVADAHSINLIAQIHEMNGQRDEIKKFKDHIDELCAPFVCHYCQFYDSLLSLHFRFDDIDSAAKLILDMHESQVSVPNPNLTKNSGKPALVPIGSHNLRACLKLQIQPKLAEKDSVLKLQHKQDLIEVKNGKLLLGNKALAKLVNGYSRIGRTAELSKLLYSVGKDYDMIGGLGLCSYVVEACIHLGWLEIAHDMIEDMEKVGAPMCLRTCKALLKAYTDREMFGEKYVLTRQMRKAGLVNDLSDDAGSNASSPTFGENSVANILIQLIGEEEKIPPMVSKLNSSIYFFCKAKMMEDALKTYRKMQKHKIQCTVETFTYLVNGYSSLEKYRDITILWGDIKRSMLTSRLVVNSDLLEFLLLNFIRGGYFERVMEVINYMNERNMFTDKWMYKSEFLKLHKNLYSNLKASNATSEAQLKRIEYVCAFRKWAGIGRSSTGLVESLCAV